MPVQVQTVPSVQSPPHERSSLGGDSLETMEGLLLARRLSPEKEESWRTGYTVSLLLTRADDPNFSERTEEWVPRLEKVENLSWDPEKEKEFLFLIDALPPDQ